MLRAGLDVAAVVFGDAPPFSSGALFPQDGNEAGNYTYQTSDSHNKGNPSGPFFKALVFCGMDKVSEGRPRPGVQIAPFPVACVRP